MFNKIDVIIIGAGLSGLVTAELLASRGKRVLLVEKKGHIGGHCYDYLNESGIYVHKYGPHIFHTDNKDVWRYLSRFTDWHYYEHKVLGVVDGKKVPIPFNLNSMEKLFSPSLFAKLEKKLIGEYGYGSRIPIMKLREAEDQDLQFLANYIYEKVFLNYTMKQWGQSRPEDIDLSVSGRVPVVVSRDDSYFHNTYQGVPLLGYTSLFNKMLDNKNIHLLLNTDGRDLVSFKDGQCYFSGQKFDGKLIYTGMIDELFNYESGELPYRSVNIILKDFTQQYFQEISVVNYPNNYDFTRITEFKYFQKNCGELSSGTTICEEHPVSYKKGVNNPYYIVESKENRAIYDAYRLKADKIAGLSVLGRLAEYNYYDMDRVVEAAMSMVSKF